MKLFSEAAAVSVIAKANTKQESLLESQTDSGKNFCMQHWNAGNLLLMELLLLP